MAGAEAEDWQRLGEHIAQRVDELGLQQHQIQAAGGPSPAKLRQLLRGSTNTLANSLRRGLERALQWPTGEVDAYLAGTATALPTNSLDLTGVPTADLVSEIERRYRRMQRLPPQDLPSL